MAFFGRGGARARAALILETMERLRGGDLGARTGLRASGEELSEIGAALDALAEKLESHEREMQRVLSEAIEEARTDGLTGLYNARFLYEELHRQTVIANRAGNPFSVIRLDIDRFKAVNDAFGHEAGDRVLRELAGVLRHAVRRSDIAIREGGEEFVIVLPNTTLEVAAERAEHIRRAVESSRTMHADKAIAITVSLGVAQHEPGAAGATAIMKAADAAMYAAKAAGRNRVMVSPRRTTALAAA